MDPREIIQDAIEYIDDHILAEIPVSELAGRAGYSYMHFCRLFRRFVGLTPKEYIIRRRLLCAGWEMSGGKKKVDLALRYGYGTYAGFYKAFRREFGLSPSAFIRSYGGMKPYRINLLQEEHIMISRTTIRELLSRWGLQEESVADVVNENTGRQIENAFYIGSGAVLKITPNPAAARRTAFFAEVIPTPEGEEFISEGGLYYILVRRMRGRQLRCEDIYAKPELAREIGRQIALLHRRLRTLEDDGYRRADLFSDCEKSLDAVRELAGLGGDFAGRYREEFGALAGKLPVQLIHRDLNPSAMFFEDGVFQGFADFDLSEINVRIFDICYCATAILSESFPKGEAEIGKWPEILRGLVAGYDACEALTEEEKQAVPYVVYSIQIICIAYFSTLDRYADLCRTNIEMLRWMIGKL